MTSSNPIVRVTIYPPLGIARVGNSSEYYLASEIPGQAPVAEGGYKDEMGRIKKQAVLFRVYGFDAEGRVVREITADEATILWRVQVANRKAGWYQFNNALDLPGLAVPSAPRNASVTGEARKALIIRPAPRSVSGKSQSGPELRFTGGKFYDQEVPLGEIRTDDKGRLIVLGGDGHSASKTGAQATTFANNDGWHDDVADGPVRATVTLDGVTLEAEPALVVVTPPNFGQGLFAVVTMYDVVLDLFFQSGWLTPPAKVVFWQQIYPILERCVQTQWVNQGFFFLFGQNSPSDFLAPALLEKLQSPDPACQEARERVFRWFRDPSDQKARPDQVPPFYGDAFGEYQNLPNDELPVTPTQYAWLRLWAEGNFETGEKPPPVVFDELPPQAQLEALQRAPLEECLGGPFHPGIEITWPFRNLILWEKPFRLKVLPEGEETPDDYGPLLAPKLALAAGGPLDGSGPGSLTRWLGVPWQTDEASCLSGYDSSTYLPLPSFWAARVPNQIFSEDSFRRVEDPSLRLGQRLKHFDYRQDWLRDFGTQYVSKINNMVQRWHELGIVTRHEADEGSKSPDLPTQYWVESERATFEKDDPTFEMVAYAEGVPPAEKALEAMSFAAAPARPARPRPHFGRGER